jgi:hypothetical protein
MFDNSLKTLNTLLLAGISATGCELDVFAFDEIDLDEGLDGKYGLYVAENKDSDFRVVITVERRLHTVKTIAGDEQVPCYFYDIYTPKYDNGDASVGMDAYYYVDTSDACDWSFMSACDTATKVLSWISEYNIRMAVDNTAEYLYALDIEEEDVA